MVGAPDPATTTWQPDLLASLTHAYFQTLDRHIYAHMYIYRSQGHAMDGQRRISSIKTRGSSRSGEEQGVAVAGLRHHSSLIHTCTDQADYDERHPTKYTAMKEGAYLQMVLGRLLMTFSSRLEGKRGGERVAAEEEEDELY
ncbi:hypothetical protein SAY87_012760 [Trapa incisa]|uniref:Uncharacterized protein n=1 Tax=Trapa incisa TaxID=236973 RepID=A0AAN7GTH1_9MYRT|nr:hypothetical protein SAY87_012760 [Trapa incisa]